jgi:hypothetical protein
VLCIRLLRCAACAARIEYACADVAAGTFYHVDPCVEGKFLVCPPDSGYLSNGQMFPDCFAARRRRAGTCFQEGPRP